VIDWITAVVPCAHATEIFGGRITAVTSDGELEWEKMRPQGVPGSHESTFHVQSRGPQGLWISGNPAKWLQGHNLFGSDELCGLVAAVMRRLTDTLEVTPTLDDYRAWEAGRFSLSRVDCTAMWELPKRSDVRAWLRAVELQAKSRHGRPIARGGTVYFGKNSRRWALKFYSKGDELAHGGKGHALPLELPMRDKLMDHADTKLRGELTLRAMQLKKLGLSHGAAWDENTPQRLLSGHIGTLQMADQFSLSSETVDGLPPRLLLVYKAWKSGEDMRQVLPLRTFYRYRKELLRHGIDINVRQPSKPDNVVSLVRVLQPQAIAQVPEWAQGTPLYFEPKRRRS
jgi:II/X family phage/plasmid replication protein